MKRLEEELTKLMTFKPVTGHIAACQALLAYEMQLCRSAGMQVSVGLSGGFPYLIAGTKQLDRSDMLLQAHIDVVPADPTSFNPVKRDGRLYGRGTYDMLFAVASFNVLIDDLQSTASLDSLDIGLILTSDEEIGGENGVKKLIDDYQATVCILPDAGDEGVLSTSAKGVLQIALGLHGTAGHGARPWLTHSPFLHIPQVLRTLDALFENTEQTTTCSITRIYGGEANNQVPGSATMTLDIRFVPEDVPQRILTELHSALTPLKIDIRVLEIGDAYRTDFNNPHVARYRSLYKQFTGVPMSQMLAPGSSDARFITPKGIPVIMTRPIGGGLHGDNEFIDIASWEVYQQVLTSYVSKGFGTV